GLVLYTKEDYAAAANELETATARNPGDQMPFLLLAAAYGQQDRKAAIAEPMAVRLVYLFRSRTFHLLFWSYFICGITTSGVIEAHLIPYTNRPNS
ncbi:MAG: hypothetical protein ACREJ8_12340, partial [Candidatus Methylomirabilales bacterium]